MGEIKMTCEYGNCKNTDGKDYVRPSELKKGDGWDSEPVFLCDLHASEFPKLLTPTNKK